MITVNPPAAPTIEPDRITLPDLNPDAQLIADVESAFEENDVRIGVRFEGPRIYNYLAPPMVRVGSLVVVPPTPFCAAPQTTSVVTLDPPPYNGPIKRVLAVLS